MMSHGIITPMSSNLSRVILTDDLAEQLLSYRQSQNITPPEASVVRQALAEFLERQGYPVHDVHPQRGGDRRE